MPAVSLVRRSIARTRPTLRAIVKDQRKVQNCGIFISSVKGLSELRLFKNSTRVVFEMRVKYDLHNATGLLKFTVTSVECISLSCLTHIDLQNFVGQNICFISKSIHFSYIVPKCRCP